jgi:DNA-binding NarL/FixJ family response regulator
MIMKNGTRPLKVYCVDDNPLVAEALELQLKKSDEMILHGCSGDAASFLEDVRGNCPDVVLLDIDMPGKDPFEAIGDLEHVCPRCRVLMYSGHLRHDLLDRALDAGAWGYVAKSDGIDELMQAIRDAAAGSMGFSRSVRSLHG